MNTTPVLFNPYIVVTKIRVPPHRAW